MDSKPKAAEIPERLKCAMENIIREATAAGYALIGIAFSNDPLSISILRNKKEDPLETFKAVVNMLERRAAVDAPTEEILVGRLN